MSDIIDFIKKLPRHKRSNVYHIQTFDQDNNLVDTKYGVNLMTDLGFDNAYVNNRESKYFVFGTSAEPPSKTSDRLGSRIEWLRETIGTPLKEYDNHHKGESQYRYNVYDSETNTLIGYRDTCQCTLDYNMLDIDGDDVWMTLHIREFGEIDRYYKDGIMPPDWDEEGCPTEIDYVLNVRSLVYDENMQTSEITKAPNQRVIITVYRSAKIDCSLFDQLRENGMYAFLDPSRLMMGEVNSFYFGQSGTLVLSNRRLIYLSVVSGRCRTEDDFPMFPGMVTKRGVDCGYGELLNFAANRGFGYDSRYWIGIRSLEGSFDGFTYYWHGSQLRNYIDFPAYNLNTKYKVYGLTIATSYNPLNITDRRSSNKSQDAEFVIIKNQLDEPEELTLDFAYTDDFLHPRFSNIFNMRHLFMSEYIPWDNILLPVNDFNMTSVKRYNSLTDSYDDEVFTNDPTYDFRNPERGLWGVITILGFNNDEPFDVGVNINTHIPVIGFKDTSDYTIYMTDSYWDPSTFVQLQDNSVVPQALQNKKYFIKTPATNNGIAGGFHTVRQPNNHTLTLSSNITDVPTDTITPLGVSNITYFRSCYASDEGWAFCNGVLIYPDSNDGNGHCYRYNLNITIESYERDLLYYTHNRVIFIRGTYKLYPTDTTNPRITVFNIDPTHPAVDPNTTATYYYDPDIMFDLSVKVDDAGGEYAKYNVEEKKNRLFISRDHQIEYIDLNNTTKNVTLTNLECTRGIVNYIFDSNYIVYYNGIVNDKYKFIVYDYINNTEYTSFYISLMPNSMIMHIIGYSTRVYIQLYIDTKYFLLEYDIVTHTCVTHENYKFNILVVDPEHISSESTSNHWINEKSSHLDYDDECFLMSAFAPIGSGATGNPGGRTVAIFKNDLDHPYYFDDPTAPVDYTVRKSFVSALQNGIPRLKKFNNGKDYVAMISGKIRISDSSKDYSTTSGNQTNFIDIGYIRNKGLHTAKQMVDNLPNPIYKMPNLHSSIDGVQANSSIESPYYYDSQNKWFTASCFYKDKVLVFNTFGPPKLVPIEMFLPHKITGTTTTVQTYNVDKKASMQSFGTLLKRC